MHPFVWLGVRARVATLPLGVTWRMLVPVAILGGIGFTMALFIAGLAFPSPEAGSAVPEPATGNPLLDAAKLGVLTASALAGVVGGLLLQRALRPRVTEPIAVGAD